MGPWIFLVVFAAGYAACWFDVFRFLRPANPIAAAIDAEKKKHEAEIVKKMMGQGGNP